ncbi:MAG: hypothetical protein WCD52_22825 [Xanthobacteraceae bacterium]
MKGYDRGVCMSMGMECRSTNYRTPAFSAPHGVFGAMSPDGVVAPTPDKPIPKIPAKINAQLSYIAFRRRSAHVKRASLSLMDNGISVLIV